VGSFNGSFANTPAHDLGAAVIAAVVARAGIDKAEVEETILGQVLTAGRARTRRVRRISRPAWRRKPAPGR
jgi:acetyl-CoA C-acetyltransferase